ncbi:MAG: arylsulfatase [Candidatus Hydrogenedentes bacterium]|nr:arylsulfatase [Candidatus Hydrogenedentota bacterium]
MALGASCATDSVRGAQQSQHPNIVVILADDFGVGDIVGLNQGGKIPTPYFDQFVRESMSFTDAHSGSAVCSPTRYGLLTGRYAWRTVLQNWVLDVYDPPLIAEDRLTLPKMLKQHGYATACIGKWHLGSIWTGEGEGRAKQVDFTVPIQQGPTTRGFDYYFGTDVPNYPPFTFIENDRVAVQPTDKMGPYDEIVHVRFEGSPMAPGWRFDEILPGLTEKAVDYIHARAKTQGPFFLYFPMTSPHEPVAPSDRFKGRSGVAPIADFLMETDWSAGQLLKALDEAGIANNTIVIVAGDNGHSRYTQMETLTKHGHLANGPYRGHKGEIWEGGHRVPFIVRWPGKIAPNTRNNQPVCLNDVMATCAAIINFELPGNAAEDSVSLLPILTGKTKAPAREALINHSNTGQFAVRQGPWKLVTIADKEKAPKYELYNLDVDAAESNNVSAQYPERIEAMIALLDKFVTEGRSTPGRPQHNDTLDIDVRHLPKAHWAKPRPDLRQNGNRSAMSNA